MAAHVEVVIPETLTIPATSEIEVMATVPLTCGGIWMVEHKSVKKPPILVANAIAMP